MNTKRLLILAATALLFSVGICFAQDRSGDAAAGLFGLGCFFIVFVSMLAISIAIMVWVYNDAKSRGVDSPILWLVLIFFTGLIGLIIYFFARPQGNLMPCPNCGKKMMETLVKCPNCGAEVGGEIVQYR